ncbi:MAG: aspartate kinase [Bacteroidetes bacterium]|nr:aspartate kinase [Bacteroidota bacterium]
MKVLKFGGSSVGSAEGMRQVANILKNGNGRRIVVLSAMSGTTNTLVEIVKCLQKGHLTEVLELTSELEQHYLKTAQNLLSENIIAETVKIIHTEFEKLRMLCKSHSSNNNINEIIIHGEFITCILFQNYFNQFDQSSQIINALDFIKTDRNEVPNYPHIEMMLQKQLQANPDMSIFITQGFASINVFGEVGNLGRGGSDYTATIIGSVLNASVVEIWTDIDGLHNNDPRFVEDTSPISQLSYEEAEELAYFGAKILHPTCIKPVKPIGIPVVLKNTFNPSAAGTLIIGQSEGLGIKAIAAKDNIISINIKSGGMMNAYGFLRRVFEIFEYHCCPVDMITTSEVAVSVTIEEHPKLDVMIKDLRSLGEVSAHKNQSIICLVGDLSYDSKGIIAMITQSMNDIPLRMISYGASKNNLCLLIDSVYKNEALNQMNQCLFKNKTYA